MKTDRPATDEFLPRICFLDESRCSGCQKCRRTYYCDVFLERVGGGVLPPLLDNRNCSGCGLCVQVCDSGALHLYRPGEMLVLVSASRERQEILRALRIPFLTYHPEQDLENFGQEKLRALVGELTGEPPASRRLQQLAAEIWDIRMHDRFVLGQGKSGLYPDLRAARQVICLETAERLLGIYGEAEKGGDLDFLPVLARAVLWSQLLWSDPGQVLWDSFILLLHTFLEEEADFGWSRRNDIPDDILDPSRLRSGVRYRISSYAVLMRRGELLLADQIPGRGEFIFAKRIFADSGSVRAYNEQGMGRGRLAGLDLRSCGSFLVEDFRAIGTEELFAMAGLPWRAIGEQLQVDAETRKDFKRLVDVVPAREEAD